MIAKLPVGDEGERTYGRQKDGRYIVQVRIRFAAHSAPVKVRGTSSLKSDRAAKREADTRLEAAIVKKRREYSMDAGVQDYDTMRSLWELWHARAAQSPADFGVRPSTVEDYEDGWRAYLDAELGDEVIAEVNTQRLARALRAVSFRRRKLKGGALGVQPEYHRGIARTCYATLAQLFDYAVELSIVDRSPVVGQIVPSGHAVQRAKLKIDAPTLHRMRELFDAYEAGIRGRYPHIEPIPLRAISELVLYGSARIGEILALETSDLDPEGIIHSDEDLDEYGLDVFIRATQKRGGGAFDPKEGKRTGSVLYRQPLTKGGEDGQRIKTVPAWVYRRFVEPRISSPRQMPPVYIFRTRNESQIERQNVNRAWVKALRGSELFNEETGLALVTPHDLRKAAAQVLADSLGMEAAQAALAHKSIRTTEGTYATKPVQRVNFARELDEVLKERTSPDEVFRAERRSATLTCAHTCAHKPGISPQKSPVRFNV